MGEAILTDKEVDELLNPPIIDVYDVFYKEKLLFSFYRYPTPEEVFTCFFYDWGTPFENLTLTEVRRIVINKEYSVCHDKRRRD